jgi:hypothetical protein
LVLKNQGLVCLQDLTVAIHGCQKGTQADPRSARNGFFSQKAKLLGG